MQTQASALMGLGAITEVLLDIRDLLADRFAEGDLEMQDRVSEASAVEETNAIFKAIEPVRSAGETLLDTIGRLVREKEQGSRFPDLEEAGRENARLLKERDDAIRARDVARKNSADCHADLVAAMRRVDDMRAQRDEAVALIGAEAQLKTELDAARAEVEAWRKTAGNLGAQLHAESVARKAAEDTLASCEESLAENSARMASMREGAEELKRMVVNLTAERDTYKALRNGADERADEWEKTAAELRAKHDAQVRELERLRAFETMVGKAVRMSGRVQISGEGERTVFQLCEDNDIRERKKAAEGSE